MATYPAFFAGTLLFGVALVVGLLYVTEVQEVRIVGPIFGLIPRRLLGVLTIAAATAVVMMTGWGRVSWATPWLATGQLRSASSGWPSALRSGTSSPGADGRPSGRPNHRHLFSHLPADHRDMNTLLGAGALLTVGGVVGYLVGVGVSYPGRAFSVTALMVGLTLFAIGSGERR